MENEAIGFPEKYLEKAGENEDRLARVVAHHGEIYRIRTGSVEIFARVSGRFAHNAQSPVDFPVVGDFVLVDLENGSEGVIQKILERSSIFSRKAAGTKSEVQPIAANIDYVFICMSLNRDFNLRRLERYLSISWDSGAVPVVVLTKSDLCDDVEKRKDEVESIAFGVDIIITSSMKDIGYDEIRKYVKSDKTVAFLGSSGVGKSTLINRLIGEDLIKTKEIRQDDDRGRHTTTTRNLFYLENGSAVIDTPGMREVGIESGETSMTFSDIEELALECKFSDCKHETEPGCAVKEAIEIGDVSEERLASFKKLKIEMGYDGLNSKQLERQKLERMFSEVGGIKNARKNMKKDNKRK